jgi:hypothetical protein
VLLADRSIERAAPAGVRGGHYRGASRKRGLHRLRQPGGRHGERLQRRLRLYGKAVGRLTTRAASVRTPRGGRRASVESLLACWRIEQALHRRLAHLPDDNGDVLRY